MAPIGKALSVVLGLVVFVFFLRFALRIIFRRARPPAPLPPGAPIDPQLAEDAAWLERAGFRHHGALQLNRAVAQLYVHDSPHSVAVVHPLAGGGLTELTFFGRCSDGLVIATNSLDRALDNLDEPRGKQRTWSAHQATLEKAAVRHGAPTEMTDAAATAQMLVDYTRAQDVPEVSRNLSLGALVLSGAGTLGIAAPFLPGIGAGRIVAWGLVAAGSALAFFNLRDSVVHWFPWLKSIRISDRVGDDPRPGLAVVRAELARLGFAPFGVHSELRHDLRDDMPTFRNEAARTWANICLKAGSEPFGYFLTQFEKGAIALTWTSPGSRIEGEQFTVDCGEDWELAFTRHLENCARLAEKHGAPLEGSSLERREAATRRYYRVTAGLRTRRLTTWPWLVARIGVAMTLLGALILAL